MNTDFTNQELVKVENEQEKRSLKMLQWLGDEEYRDYFLSYEQIDLAVRNPGEDIVEILRYMLKNKMIKSFEIYDDQMLLIRRYRIYKI